MRKTITLDLGETNELNQFLDEYVLDEMRGAINDLDLSEITIAHMQKLLDKTKRHFRSQIVETEKADAEPVWHGKWTRKHNYGSWECSECGCKVNRTNPLKGNIWNYYYCPNCGARMDEDV